LNATYSILLVNKTVALSPPPCVGLSTHKPAYWPLPLSLSTTVQTH